MPTHTEEQYADFLKLLDDKELIKDIEDSTSVVRKMVRAQMKTADRKNQILPRDFLTLF